MSTNPSRRAEEKSLAELAAAAHTEAARIAELGGHPAAARRYASFAMRVRRTLRDFEARSSTKRAD